MVKEGGGGGCCGEVDMISDMKMSKWLKPASLRDCYASLVLSDEFNVLATSKVGTQVLPGFSYMLTTKAREKH